MGGDSLEMNVDGSPVGSDSVRIEDGEAGRVITVYSERPDEAPGAIPEDLGQRLRLAQALRHAADGS